MAISINYIGDPTCYTNLHIVNGGLMSVFCTGFLCVLMLMGLGWVSSYCSRAVSNAVLTLVGLMLTACPLVLASIFSQAGCDAGRLGWTCQRFGYAMYTMIPYGFVCVVIHLTALFQPSTKSKQE